MSNRFVSTMFSSGEDFEDFLKKMQAFIDGVKNGEIVIPNAKSATKATNATKATQDSDGNVIKDTYAKKSDLTAGTITVAKATKDGNGNVIPDTYAKKSDLTAGNITVAKATKDGNGNVIKDTYAKKSDLTDGTITVAKATSAESAGSATNDALGYIIHKTYASVSTLSNGNLVVKKATEDRQGYKFIDNYLHVTNKVFSGDPYNNGAVTIMALPESEGGTYYHAVLKFTRSNASTIVYDFGILRADDRNIIVSPMITLASAVNESHRMFLGITPTDSSIDRYQYCEATLWVYDMQGNKVDYNWVDTILELTALNSDFVIGE